MQSELKKKEYKKRVKEYSLKMMNGIEEGI